MFLKSYVGAVRSQIPLTPNCTLNPTIDDYVPIEILAKKGVVVWDL